MKYCLILILGLNSGILFAQDSIRNHVETPKIVLKLPLGKSYTYNNVSIKFVDVLEDSRCPKDVTCIWAGQVKVLIEIYKNKTLLEQKEIIFESGKDTSENARTVFVSNTESILVLSVLPYPESSRKKIKKEAYYLQLEISN